MTWIAAGNLELNRGSMMAKQKKSKLPWGYLLLFGFFVIAISVAFGFYNSYIK